MSVDTEFLVAEIPKNTREVIHVSLSEFKGHKLCHIRVWVKNSEDAEPIPTKNGFGVRVARLSDLRKALDIAQERAAEFGWE